MRWVSMYGQNRASIATARTDSKKPCVWEKTRTPNLSSTKTVWAWNCARCRLISATPCRRAAGRPRPCYISGHSGALTGLCSLILSIDYRALPTSIRCPDPRQWHRRSFACAATRRAVACHHCYQTPDQGQCQQPGPRRHCRSARYH